MKDILTGMILWDYERKTWIVTYKKPIEKKRRKRRIKKDEPVPIYRRDKFGRIILKPKHYQYWANFNDRDHKKYNYS
jgi:hypothetical protein